MQLPSEHELAQLGCEFDYLYPNSYFEFVRSPDLETLSALDRRFPNGWFIKAIADIRKFVDAEMTKDEFAPFFVNGSRQQMANITPYGVPQGLTFYGFDTRRDLYPDLVEPPVVVFSIHTYVAGWNSLADFMEYITAREGWVPGKYGHFVRTRSSFKY